MIQENKAYIVQLIKQIVHPYFAEEIADILIANGMTFKTEPHTNADRIRSMSDEELAVFVRSIIIAEDCPAPGCDCDKCFFKEPCFNGSKWHGKEIEWLQQPAE